MSKLSELATRLGLTRPLAFVDLETTGVNVETDRIVEIGILRVHPSGRVDCWESLINPGLPIPPEATEVHHITDAMVFDAPRFHVIAPVVATRLKGCDLAGYNLRRYDRRMLEAEFRRTMTPWPCADAKVVDPYAVFVQKERRDLEAAVEFYCGESYEIPEGNGQQHRALFDAAAAAHVLLGQTGCYPDLPRTLEGLHVFCEQRDPNWIDAEGKIAWKNGEAVVTFGKNAGRSLRDLSCNDPSFLAWMLQKDFPADTKGIVHRALSGRFPTKPATEAA
jgi:DNA polymerase-3 subunit epsilon